MQDAEPTIPLEEETTVMLMETVSPVPQTPFVMPTTVEEYLNNQDATLPPELVSLVNQMLTAHPLLLTVILTVCAMIAEPSEHKLVLILMVHLALAEETLTAIP